MSSQMIDHVLRYIVFNRYRPGVQDSMLLDMLLAANAYGMNADRYGSSFPEIFATHWWIFQGDTQKLKRLFDGSTAAREPEPIVRLQPNRELTDAQKRTEKLRAEFSKRRKKIIRQLLRRAGVRSIDEVACPVCAYSNTQMHVDHVIPLSRGGSNEIDNLQFLCAECNHRKGAQTMVEWLGDGWDDKPTFLKETG